MEYPNLSNSLFEFLQLKEKQLHSRLNSGRLSKTKITILVEELIEHPELVGALINEIHIEDKAGTFNASWVFDHLMRKKLVYLLPFIEEFTSRLDNLTSESCIRPIAHVCEMLCESYFVNNDSVFINSMKKNHLEFMVNTCFDWLIGEHKMAAKVFSMTSLLYLGQKFEWIHPELKMVLESTVPNGSAGYKNRGEKTLDKLVALGH